MGRGSGGGGRHSWSLTCGTLAGVTGLPKGGGYAARSSTGETASHAQRMPDMCHGKSSAVRQLHGGE
eukprot:9482295-Pyramimonas_sp.AAC.1